MTKSMQFQLWRLAIVAAAILAAVQVVSTEESEDYLKDLHIRQMPMATDLTPPAVTPGSPEASLAVSAAVDRPDRSYRGR